MRKSFEPVGLASLMMLAVAQAGCAPKSTPHETGERPTSITIPQDLLDGSTLPMFVDPVPTFAGRRINGAGTLTVDMEEFQQKVLPASYYAKLPAPYNKGTTLWGYNVNGSGASWPGVTVEAQQGRPTSVVYSNSLRQPDGSPPSLQAYLTQDLTLHWADPTGVSAANGCVQGDENGGTNVANMSLIGGTQQAFAANGPCAMPYAGPVPTVPHLHGAEVLSAYDGHPDAWFTAGLAFKGKGFVSNVYHYPNLQEATTLWFHDHSLGTTRLNVFSGLAAFYFIRDNRDTGRTDNPIGLPAGKYEQELLIADRIFDTNGQLIFPDGSDSANGSLNGYNGAPGNPNLHPYAIPEFFGDVITVNGKSWPYMNVEPRRYRFRIVNGSNARFYSMQLSAEDRQGNKWSGVATQFTDASGVGTPGPHIWQIGSDGGFLNEPTDVDALAMPNTTALLNTTPDPPHLFLAPGERADIIIDFSGFEGQRLIVTNTAAAPFPNGGAVVEPIPGPKNSPQTKYDIASQVMEFRVDANAVNDTSFDPAGQHRPLRAQPMPDYRAQALAHPDVHRQLVLDEVEDVTTGGPVEVILNNSHWDGRREGSKQAIAGSVGNGHGLLATELPQVGSTELWEIANLTPDAHPIHIHLIEFQVIDVQPFLTEHGLCDQFSGGNQDFAHGQEYRPAWDAEFSGGTFNGYSFAPGHFIPGYGPPNDYSMLNTDGAVGGNLAFSTVLNSMNPAFLADKVKPAARDAGWKDTLKVFPCAVTRIAVRWAPQSLPVGATKAGVNPFPFDPTTGGPGYVWHCHIIDHEDNEMMRPILMTK